MSRKQSGFGTVEGLLIVIIILLLGFIGWYVWHSTKNANSTYNNAASSTVANASKPKTPVNPYAGWQTIKSSDGAMSINIPQSWVNTQCPSNGNIYVSSSKATAAVCNSGNIGEAVFISDTTYAPDTSFHQYSNDLVTTSVTLNGIKGQRVTYTLASDVPGAEAGTKGTAVMEYNFNKDGKGFYADYYLHPGGPDDTTVFKQIVQSWKF